MLRHSTFYWLNEGSKPHSDWGVPKCNAGGLSVTFSWGSVLAADAGGAVAGAVRTGILGLAGGPISWTAAGIAAAATGIGSSCGNIIYQLFH